MTLALLKDDEFIEEQEIAHSSEIEATNKAQKNVDPDALQDMIGGLRSGPPAEKFNENLFDGSAAKSLGIAAASDILVGPQASDFADDAKSAKIFMLQEGLLEQSANPQEESRGTEEYV